jgi:hypothetical protein
MARVEIPYSVINTTSGAAVSGASAQVNLRGAGAATVFAAETGGTTLPNPLTSDSNGRIEGWVDEGSYDITVSGGSITTYTVRMEANRGDGTTKIGDGAVAAGTFKHVGNIGFYNVAPIAQNTGWGTITPPAIGLGKAPLSTTSTTNDIIRYLAELAAALKAYGLLGT